ncbi:MAG: Uma2 family endonuclease [Anaerolineaceae bacterium]|nr:Uma2 family endonuclease [Anaerolineaceae bacterium]
MALPKNTPATMTEEEYLAFERQSDIKHEYLNGEIFAMSGASRKHILICVSTTNALFDLLSNDPCEIYQTDMRVKVGTGRLYTYPDIVIACGEPEFTEDKEDTLLNPIIIIEVLSPSTEIYDRGKKFQYYREIESLREYILVSQDSPRVERYLRQENDAWLYTDANGLDAHITLESVGCTLPLANMYRKVTFTEGNEAAE